MTRDEHMKWCKQRAIELIESGDINQGLVSMMSDLGKHDETKNHSGIMLTTMLMMGGQLKTTEEALKHIEGFN